MPMPSHDEARVIYEQKMGKELGSAYHLLWNLCAQLHVRWAYYCGLFGTDEESIAVMNGVAPSLFRTIQDTLWESTLLDLAKFCDPIPTGFGRPRPLSLALLASFVPKGGVERLEELLNDVKVKTAFARDWRHRRIAHWDHLHAIDPSAKPLIVASRAAVKEALAAITRALEAFELHFTSTCLCFDGGESEPRYLIHELAFMQRLRAERKARLRDGTATPDDIDWKKWH